MEPVPGVQLGALIVNIIAVGLTMVGILIGFYKFIYGKLDEQNTRHSEKINRVYSRMDELNLNLVKKIEANHDLVHRDFVLQKIHDLERKHQDDRIDTKFASILELFKLQFESLRASIDNIKQNNQDHTIKQHP